MTRPLNGCMCQDGSCESCNRVLEAWEAMREALRQIAYEPQGHPEANDREVLNACVQIARVALMADEAAKGKP